MSGASKAASTREREGGPPRFPGWRAVPAALAGLVRGGREAKKTGPGGPKRQRARDEARDRLTETD